MRVPQKMRHALALAGVLALGLAIAAGSRAAETDFVRLGYAGFLGNVQMVEASVGLELPMAQPAATAAPTRYRMGIDVVMSGPMARLVPFTMTAESRGTAGSGGVRPALHTSMTRIYERGQAMRLAYGEGGKVEITADPPTVEARTAREQNLAQGTLDPLSAVVALVDEVIRRGECGGNVAVFDGTRRFDLQAKPAGTGQVEKIGMSLYEGPAVQCEITPVFIHGFRQADVDAGLYPQSATMWLAPVVAGAPPVPVRVIGRSKLGTLRLDLMEAWAMAGGCAEASIATC